MRINVIGRGTFYRDLVRECADLDIRAGTNTSVPDLYVNWGLAGERWRAIQGDLLIDIPVINSPINSTKFTQLQAVKEAGVPCLPTERRLPVGADARKWIFKPMFSLGGRHISLVGFEPRNIEGYYQLFIPGRDRRYELRVHACLWRDESEYLVQKRVNEDRDALTWNHHTGGRFITVERPTAFRVFREAMGHATKALKALGLQFGGVDFIVTEDGGVVWFLEVNMAMGLRIPASLNYWADNMKLLLELSDRDIFNLINPPSPQTVEPDPPLGAPIAHPGNDGVITPMGDRREPQQYGFWMDSSGDIDMYTTLEPEVHIMDAVRVLVRRMALAPVDSFTTEEFNAFQLLKGELDEAE